MSTVTNIKDAIQSNITETATEKTLSLAQDALPGEIQSIIGDYLNGITIPLGSSTSLTVNPSTKELEVKATLSDATLDLTGTADKAVLTVASTAATSKGATITLTFTLDSGNVSLELDAKMGDTLKWPIQDVWPKYLDWSPANKLTMAKGELDLTVSTSRTIDFKGTGSMLYDNAPLANGAVRVSYEEGETGVLIGAVVTTWSPGTFWPPLDALTFKDSGLVFSTLKSKSSSLVGLGLIPDGAVPALGGDFDISPGMVFFTSLTLDGVLESVSNALGLESELDVFASYSRPSDTGASTVDLKATLTDTFSAQGKDIFQFNGFTLDWQDPQSAGGTISASANGTFNPDPNSAVKVNLTGSVMPSSGDFSLSIGITDWVQPLGIKTLTVTQVDASVIVGAQAEGVTLAFDGELKLQNPDVPANEFEVGFEFEIADFEVPTGIAVWMEADQKKLDLSNAVNAAFAVDFSPEHLKAEGEVELGEIVQVIDDLIKIKAFEFWFVEGADLKKIGDHGPYKPGFGVQGDFELFDQEDIRASVIVVETGDDPGFSGSADFEQEIKFGEVLDIAGWNEKTQSKTDTGPQFAISATKAGTIVKGVNDDKPMFFYASGYLSFMDLVAAHIYGIATPDGLIQFSESVQAGTPVGTTGAWAGESITFGVNPKKYEVNAGFSFNFGWKNIEWPAVKLWGFTLIPSGKLPDFNVDAGLNVFVSVSQAQFAISGHFDFDLFGLNLNWGSPGHDKSLVSVDLKSAITSIGHIASALLTQVEHEASALMEDVLDSLEKFVSWIKGQLDKFVDALKVVAEILKEKFEQVGKEIVTTLKEIGATAAAITKVLVDDLGYAAREVEGWVEDIFGCAMKAASNLL